MSSEDEQTQEIRRTAAKIREKRKLIIMESREKRKVEKERLPRTAKKIVAKEMEKSMEELGLEIENKEEVMR